MKIYLKGLNSCSTRKQKLKQYRNFLLANGCEIVNNPDDSDIILLWTCAFRSDLRDNSLAEVIRYQKEHSSGLVVAGCLPDIAPDLLKNIFPGRIIRWRDDKKKMTEIFGNEKFDFNQVSPIFCEENLCQDVEKFRKENPRQDAMFYDQFIKLVVSEGCNYNCAYCSEKLAFPAYHSFPEEDLIDACRLMIKNTGCQEVALLADSIGDYGCDIGSNLPALIHKLESIHPDLKIVLNHLHPASFIKFFDEMAGFFKAGLIKHLNLPVQSASNRILKLMNRMYTKEDIEKIFDFLNSIGSRDFDTHVLIGFPGETQEDFQETVQFILKHKPKYVLASSFMESRDMPAYNLSSKINEQAKQRRLQDFEKQMQACGIICNTNDSKLSLERLRRLNLT